MPRSNVAETRRGYRRIVYEERRLLASVLARLARPQVQIVEKIVERPQVQTLEKIVEVPQVQTVEKASSANAGSAETSASSSATDLRASKRTRSGEANASSSC